MTPAEWVLTALVYLLAGWLIAALVAVRRARRPVVGLRRQESTDKLPVSLALFGAWTRPGQGHTEEELEAVRQRVRELHPDLGSALDRCVDVHTTRANLAARRVPAQGQPTPDRPFVHEHEWRRVEGTTVEGCITCGDLRG